MKKNLLFMFVVLAALLSVSAFADVEVSSPALGSSSADREETVSTTFTIKNTDPTYDLILTGDKITSTADAKYSINFTNVPATIAPNATATVTITGYVPADLDAVDSSYQEAAMPIGSLTVTGTLNSAAVSKNADMTMQAENNARIEKLRVEKDGSRKSIDDGDTFKNIRPGDSLTYELEIGNHYSNNEDVEMDISIEIDSSNSDVEIDEEDDEIDDLGAEEEDTVTGEFIVEEEADSDATITVIVSATDKNGAKHGEKLDFKLDINRLTHEIQIRRLLISPETTDNCKHNEVVATVYVKNMGKRDEKNAAVELEIPDLNFKEKKELPYELEKDDSATLNFIIPIETTTAEGVFNADVTTFWDTIAQSNTQRTQLTITKCAAAATTDDDTTTGTTTDTTTTTTDDTTDETGTATAAKAAPKKAGLGDNSVYLVILGALSTLVLIVIIAIVIYTVRTGNKKY